jgi:hypothetical protein
MWTWPLSFLPSFLFRTIFFFLLLLLFVDSLSDHWSFHRHLLSHLHTLPYLVAFLPTLNRPTNQPNKKRTDDVAMGPLFCFCYIVSSHPSLLLCGPVVVALMMMIDDDVLLNIAVLCFF